MYYFFLSFLSNQELRAEWILKLQLDPSVPPNMKICDKHFTENDFTCNINNTVQRRRLLKNAIPFYIQPTKRYFYFIF